MQPTGSSHDLALRPSTFSTLCEALDYAAGGGTGVNFYNARGELYATASYAELREQALELARRLIGLGIEKGGRVGLVAETTPDFVRFFWACQYAGPRASSKPAAAVSRSRHRDVWVGRISFMPRTAVKAVKVNS